VLNDDTRVPAKQVQTAADCKTPLDAALHYIVHGRRIIPIKHRSKQPTVKEWQSLVITTENASYYFKGDANIGLVLGGASGGVVDVDLDCREAIALAPYFLSPTEAIFGRASKPDSHWLYVSDLHETETDARLVVRDDAKVVAELRIGAAPAQTVMPTSTHVSGEAIAWQAGKSGEPTFVAGSTLKQAFGRLAVAILLVRHWDQGLRNDATNALAGWLARLGLSETDAENLVVSVATAAGDDEVTSRKRAVGDTYKKHVAKKKTTGLPALTKLFGSEITDQFLAWLAPVNRQLASVLPDMTVNGVPRPTLLNTKTAITLLGIECRYDLFKLRHEINGQPIQQFAGALTDHAIHEVRSVIRERFGFEPKKETVLDAIHTLANHHRFHPVRDYLDGLTWDGVPRIDRWLATYGGAEDTAYIRAVGALMLVAAVRRVRSPGAKFDEMLVLESEQGADKSQALSTLAVKPEWFSDQYPLGVRGREAIEATAGAWIVEVPELNGMRKGDVEKIKATLSSSVDRGRMAYGITVTEAPRQFVLVGTTNAQAYLRDLTGNRRFWPVAVKRFDLEALKRDRDQLWAEASIREAAGASIRLDPSLWPSAKEEQEDRVVENPFVAVLDHILRERHADGSDQGGPPLLGRITVNDLWIALGIRPERRHQGLAEQLADAMQTLGWQKSRLRVEGRRSYVYVSGPEPHRPIGVLAPDPDGISYLAFYDDVSPEARPVRRMEKAATRDLG
jgi:hypothetical protein